MDAPARTREFDLFGPWIDEVASPDDVPVLYRSFPLDLDRARLVLKVPRNIARRDAAPGMDLYDHLLVLADETLTVLSRDTHRAGSRSAPTPGGYTTASFRLSEITAIRATTDLLAGMLTIHARAADALHVRFNGSARDKVDQLVHALVEGTATVPPGRAGRAILDAPPAQPGRPDATAMPADQLLVSDLDEAARRVPTMVPLAWHGRRPVRRAGTGAAGAVRVLANAFAPVDLQAAILARTPSAVEVFTRHDWVLRQNRTVTSSTRITVPLGALADLSIAPHDRYGSTSTIRLGTAAGPVELHVPYDSGAVRLVEAARARA